MPITRMIQSYFTKTLLVRHDNSQGLFYFSHKDFPGLRSYAYSFRARQGHTLNGWFYCYDTPNPDRLMVFDHGMGNGHRAYMVEVERLARAGLLVFTYDHTGCMTSGGTSIGGFSQSLSDLDACLEALKQLPQLRGRAISVMGHSWGGFSTMNIPALHKDITHVVSMSGFISPRRILAQFLPPFMKRSMEALLTMERKACPEYAEFDALDTLATTRARVLLICSDNDTTVSPRHHFQVLRQALEGRENIRFLTVHGRGHNPNYTDDAVAYMDAFFRKLGKCKNAEKRKALIAAADWKRMTAQDEALWKRILEHLEV